MRVPRAVIADRCTLEGATGSIHLDGDYTGRVGASKLVGGATKNGTAAMTCVGSYNGSNQALGADCLVPGP